MKKPICPNCGAKMLQAYFENGRSCWRCICGDDPSKRPTLAEEEQRKRRLTWSGYDIVETRGCED